MQSFLLIIKQALRRFWRMLVDRDILTFLLFIGLAYLLWAGRTMSSPHEAVVTLPVSYLNIPQAAEFQTNLPATWNIKVKDTGRHIMHLRQEKPVLTLDMGPLMASRNGKVQIGSESLFKMIKEILPATATLLECKPDVLHANYVMQPYKNLSVTLTGQWTMASQYQLKQAPQIQPQTIAVYGSKNRLTQVTELVTEPIQLKHLSDSTTIRVALVHPANVRLAKDSVSVTFLPEQFTEKRFTLPIHAIGKAGEMHLRLFPREAEVIARVGMDQYQQINEADFQVTCPYPNPGDSILPLKVSCKNPAITQMRVNPSEVEFLLEH